MLDLPLVSGADDSRLGGDVLGKAERLAAELWGADMCRFSVADRRTATSRSHWRWRGPATA